MWATVYLFKLFLVFVVFQAKGEVTNITNAVQSTDVSCVFAPGLAVGNETQVMECCNQTVRRFHIFWSQEQLYLTTYLQTLSTWGCPQFTDECHERLFVFNPFMKTVYDYFCNYTDVFVPECYQVVTDLHSSVGEKQNSPSNLIEASGVVNDTLVENWQALIRELNSSFFTIEELISIPCLQVALYEAEDEHRGEYVELIRLIIPTCYPVWCGVDGASIRGRMVSVWNCLSSDCRVKVQVIMAVCGLLSVIVTFANLTVILVYYFNRNLLHSQGIYKVSLAVADILTGLIVFPSFISTISRISSGIVTHADFYNATGFQVVNGTRSNETSVVQIRPASGSFKDSFNQTYLDAIGFFITLSITTSVYCLTVAGFDRMTAVYRPLSYRKDKAKKFSKWLCLVIWGFGVFFGALPIFIPALKYGLVVSVIILSGGQSALILYVIAFILPLLVMWVVNAVTFHSTRKHARVRRHITIDSKKKTDSIEVRLARTLSIMVGVFTLSLLPAVIVILATFFVPTINPTNPRSYDLGDAVAYNSAEFATILILTCNSLWNFFIYNARNLEFRKGVQVMFKKMSAKIGLMTCFSTFLSCAQSVVHDGRRRFSSLPNISSSLGGKKSSLFPTTATNLNSKTKSSDVSSSDANSGEKSSRALSSAIETSNDVVGISESAPSSGEKKKGKKDQVVSEDSVFQSFAIDARADHLYESVMERIDEEIEVAGRPSSDRV